MLKDYMSRNERMQIVNEGCPRFSKKPLKILKPGYNVIELKKKGIANLFASSRERLQPATFCPNKFVIEVGKHKIVLMDYKHKLKVFYPFELKVETNE